jgi:acyl-CoA synthetase (AMP-forming)/AMP-acid ligase II
VLDALSGTAERSPRRGVYVIDEKGNQEFRTYPQILEAALRVGAALERRGLGNHDRILFVLPTSFEFLTGFFGALSVGAIPVPIAPPRDVIADSSDRAEAVLRLAERLKTPAALFSTREEDASRPPQVRELRHVMDISGLVDGVPVGATPRSNSYGEIAYIQTTSGATGRRRAAELTHRNILTNVRAVGKRLRVTESDIGVSWLPLHSILGLVGVVLFTLYWDLDAVLMHPDRFLRRPEEGLHLFGRHDGTLAASPSFGFDYCVRRCQESNLKGLDLTSWRVALNGGEPVRPEHMEGFRRRFGRYGLRDDVFTPVYGLTEATLGVAFAEIESPVHTDRVNREALERDGVATAVEDAPRDEFLEFVSVGTPLPDIDVMIIDHRGIEVGERIVGEIAVRGPNVMRGYFGSPKKSSAGGTRISGEWLMTGDLGYVSDGELFVVGRRVERIGFDDHELSPQPIEDVVDSIDGVRVGSAVVFGTDDDRLVVALEVQPGAETDEIEALVRSRLHRRFRLEPDEVVCLSPQSVPRSPTGKIRRHLVRRFYEEGILDRKARTQEFDAVRRLLQRSRHEVMKLGQTLAGSVRRLISKDE